MELYLIHILIGGLALFNPSVSNVSNANQVGIDYHMTPGASLTITEPTTINGVANPLQLNGPSLLGQVKNATINLEIRWKF